MELRPPPEFGFPGTIKYYRLEHAITIAQLKARGYTEVINDRTP